MSLVIVKHKSKKLININYSKDIIEKNFNAILFLCNDNQIKRDLSNTAYNYYLNYNNNNNSYNYIKSIKVLKQLNQCFLKNKTMTSFINDLILKIKFLIINLA